MSSFTTARRNRLQKGRAFRERREEAGENDINLLQLVHDAYYSMNITQLAKHAAFLLLGIFLMLMHVSNMNGASNTAYFRTSITQQLATSYDLDNEDLPVWKNVNSFDRATEYFTSFLNAAIDESDKKRAPLGDRSSVMLGAYGKVMYARLIVNFLENCETWRGYTSSARLDRCILKSKNATIMDDMFRLKNDTLDYDRWHDSHAKYYKFRSSANSKKDWSALVVIANGTNSANLQTRADFRRTLETHVTPAHVAAIGKYAYAVGLDIIAFNTLTTHDYAIFSLRAQRSSSGKGVAKEAFQKLSVTTPGKRYLYTTTRDNSRKALEVVFWLAFFWLVTLDYAQWRLAHRQGCSFWRYVFTPWNTYTIVINGALCAWLVWYLILLVGWKTAYKPSIWATPKLETCSDFYRYEFYPAKYTEWVYWGVAVMLLVGMRMLQFTRLHSGLNVFHDVFVKTMRDLADFFAVFIFILCLLGTCVYLIFQVSGGNSNWITWWDGASVLSRLAFQYASYDDIYNDGIGAGRWGPVVTAIFWLSVAALLVWSGNIFLSAVSYAYGAVRDRNPQVEVFFLWEVLLRFFCFFTHFYWMFGGYHLHKGKDKDTGGDLAPSPPILPPINSGGPPTNGQPTVDIEMAAPTPRDDDTPLGAANGRAQPDRSQRSGLQNLMDSFRGQHSADVGMPRTGSRGVAGREGTQRFMAALRAPGKRSEEWFKGCRSWWHLTDIRFYELFYVEKPAKYPRWYMLSRWAVASRPEMRALAVYFTDFRTFTLARVPPNPPASDSAADNLQASTESFLRASTSTMPLNASLSPANTSFDAGQPSPQAQANPTTTPLSPGERASLCYHMRGEGEVAAPGWIRSGVREFISQSELKQLLAQVQAVHPATLTCARPWFFMFPMRMTKYLLGYFWLDEVHDAIFAAIKKVYNPQFMKDIESSFAIDEDEEGAVPTLRDLQSRVQEPLAALARRTDLLERLLLELREERRAERRRSQRVVDVSTDLGPAGDQEA